MFDGERFDMNASAAYNLAFAAAVCVVCALVVSSSNVSLKDLQEANEALEKQRNVLVAAGLATTDERLSPAEVDVRFGAIRPVVVDLESGQTATDIDPDLFDQDAATADIETSNVAPENAAQVRVTSKLLLGRRPSPHQRAVSPLL